MEKYAVSVDSKPAVVRSIYKGQKLVAYITEAHEPLVKKESFKFRPIYDLWLIDYTSHGMVIRYRTCNRVVDKLLKLVMGAEFDGWKETQEEI